MFASYKKIINKNAEIVINVVPRSGCIRISNIRGNAGRIEPIISFKLFIPFLYFSTIQ